MREWLQKVFIGVCAVIIGAFIFFQTANFAMFLVIALGIYAVLNGAFVIYTGVKAPFRKPTRITVVTRGGISLAVGLCAVLLPMTMLRITWITMLYVVGIQLLISGILGIIGALEMHRYGMPIISRMVEAVLSIALALLILFMPEQIGETLLKVLGVFVVGYGIMLVVKGYSLRNDHDFAYYRSPHRYDRKSDRRA